MVWPFEKTGQKIASKQNMGDQIMDEERKLQRAMELSGWEKPGTEKLRKKLRNLQQIEKNWKTFINH